METAYPIFYFYHSKGIKALLNGDLDYNKFEAAVKQSFFRKNIRKTTYRLEGGYIDKLVHYGLLFTGEGSCDKSVPVMIKNTFQTMRLYEFLSDKYISLFTFVLTTYLCIQQIKKYNDFKEYDRYRF